MKQKSYFIRQIYKKQTPNFMLKEIFSEKSSKSKMSEKWIELIKSEFPNAKVVKYSEGFNIDKVKWNSWVWLYRLWLRDIINQNYFKY